MLQKLLLDSAQKIKIGPHMDFSEYFKAHEKHT